MGSYNRRFINNFSVMVEPLTELKEKKSGLKCGRTLTFDSKM